MKTVQLILAVPVALVLLGPIGANAGQTITDAGAIACINDKWDEKEVEKGHKLVDFAGRCVNVPNDSAEPKHTEDCVGKYEFMPDESWKGSGSCTYNFKGGDTITDTFEEGSHLKEYHIQDHRRHRQISRRQRRRHVFLREPNRHARRRHLQGQDRACRSEL